MSVLRTCCTRTGKKAGVASLISVTRGEWMVSWNWLKLTPDKALDFGEYALVEVLSTKEINLGVWDFGVHPTAPENRDALKPEPKRRLDLERRRKSE